VPCRAVTAAPHNVSLRGVSFPSHSTGPALRCAAGGPRVTYVRAASRARATVRTAHLGSPPRVRAQHAPDHPDRRERDARHALPSSLGPSAKTRPRACRPPQAQPASHERPTPRHATPRHAVHGRSARAARAPVRTHVARRRPTATRDRAGEARPGRAPRPRSSGGPDRPPAHPPRDEEKPLRAGRLVWRRGGRPTLRASAFAFAVRDATGVHARARARRGIRSRAGDEGGGGPIAGYDERGAAATTDRGFVASTRGETTCGWLRRGRGQEVSVLEEAREGGGRAS